MPKLSKEQEALRQEAMWEIEKSLDIVCSAQYNSDTQQSAR